MSLEKLASAALSAREEIKRLAESSGNQPWMNSVNSQMEFIERKAKNGENPVKCLNRNEEFTYGIISSRELSSPDEMKVKEKLNKVSEILRSLWK